MTPREEREADSTSVTKLSKRQFSVLMDILTRHSSVTLERSNRQTIQELEAMDNVYLKKLFKVTVEIIKTMADAEVTNLYAIMSLNVQLGEQKALSLNSTIIGKRFVADYRIIGTMMWEPENAAALAAKGQGRMFSAEERLNVAEKMSLINTEIQHLEIKVTRESIKMMELSRQAETVVDILYARDPSFMLELVEERWKIVRIKLT